MRIFTKQQLQTALATLSPELQELVLSDTINFPLIDAMRDAGLSVEQRARVGTSATCVMLGLATVDDFVRSLTTDVGLAGDVAQTLAQNIEQNVFRVMRESATQTSATQKTSTLLGTVETLRTTRANRIRGGAPDIITLFDTTAHSRTPVIDVATDAFIMERWQVVPHPVRNTILDQEYRSAVRNATSQYVLSEASMTALEEEVLMTLLGLQSKIGFSAYLPSIGGLTQNDAKHIAEYIDTHFFALLSPYLDEVTADSLQVADTAKLTGTPPHPSSTVGEGVHPTTSPLEQFVNKQPDVLARFQKLPEGVRSAILSDAVAQAFSGVVRTYNLTQEYFMFVGNEAVRVMVGLATTKEFRARIAGQQLADQTTTETLARAVEQGMFKPVRDAIVTALAQRSNRG